MSSTVSHAVRDSATMLRRNLLHIKRYPSMTVPLITVPVALLLVFVYVFGGMMGSGLPGVSGGRAEYLGYIVPGIVLMAAATVAQGTAISIATDMTEGLIARFRTMSIARGSIFTGHVLASTIQVVCSGALMIGMAVLLGYRPGADAFGWAAATGLVALIGFALAWITTALGMMSRTIEMAGSLPMPLMFLPFLGSGFVPTDSLPAALRWFAEYQPFTPMMEALRGLLTGNPDMGATWVALAWCLGLSLTGYLCARHRFDRTSTT